MVKLISLILFLVFLFLSLIHFYWAFGGKWGTEGVYPAKADGRPMKPPGIVATLIVAVGLLCFGLFYLIKGGFISTELPLWLNEKGLWILSVIFVLRAIGDFKYLGFFKKVKNSRFAISDTKFYSPLCLLIGILTLILVLNR